MPPCAKISNTRSRSQMKGISLNGIAIVILFSIILFFFLLLILRDLFFFLPIFRRRRTVEVGDNRDEAAALVELMILKSDVIAVCHVIMQIDVVFHYQIEDGTLIDFRKWPFLNGDCTLVADKLK